MEGSAPAPSRFFHAAVFGLAGLGLAWGVSGALLTAAGLLPSTALSALLAAGGAVGGVAAAMLLARRWPRYAVLACWIAALGVGVALAALAARAGAPRLLPATLCAAIVLVTAWAALELTALFPGAALAPRYALVAAVTLAAGAVQLWVYDLPSIAFAVSGAVALFGAGYALYRAKELERRFATDEIAPAALALGGGLFEGVRALALLVIGHEE